MAQGPWGTRFVGSHILLNEPGKQNDSWDKIPSSWYDIRFDAVDILFISPFFVKIDDNSLMLSSVEDNGSLLERFQWVIRAARSKNPKIKIILEQFYGTCPGGSDYKAIHESDDKIKRYADSVAKFIDNHYNLMLPALNGGGQISARIDGLDVDVEGGTMVSSLPKILTAVRSSLDTLSKKLSAPGFTVSITPAWTNFLDESVAKSCNYINMQNYSGGQSTTPEAYLTAVPGLRKEQLAWGFASETPWTSTTDTFAAVKAKAQEVANGQYAGTYTWRLNSNNYAYENIFQVYLYDSVHGASLPDAKPETIVERHWPFGGRRGGREGEALTAQQIV